MKRARLFRGNLGMSPEKLADRAGLHRTQLSVIERGLRNIRLDTLVSLAGALGVPETSLLTESGEELKPAKRGRPRKMGQPANE